jgi:hypothetical protein
MHFLELALGSTLAVIGFMIGGFSKTIMEHLQIAGDGG